MTTQKAQIDIKKIKIVSSQFSVNFGYNMKVKMWLIDAKSLAFRFPTLAGRRTATIKER